jgi:insertion element IS1 protein InsB
MQCPRCSSQKIIKNGSIANGMCKDCSRKFVENPQIKIISKETWEIVDRLLVEKISLAGISRVLVISKRWLRKYLKEKRNEVPKKPFKMSTNKKIHIEVNGLWTYSGNKENDLWLWVAVEIKTRLIVGTHLGKRDIEGAQGSL